MKMRYPRFIIDPVTNMLFDRAFCISLTFPATPEEQRDEMLKRANASIYNGPYAYYRAASYYDFAPEYQA